MPKANQILNELVRKTDYKPIEHAITEITDKRNAMQTAILGDSEIKWCFDNEVLIALFGKKFNAEELQNKYYQLSKSKEGKGFEYMVNMLKDNIIIEGQKEIIKK